MINSRTGRFVERSISFVFFLWCFIFLVYSKVGLSHNYGDRTGNYTDGSVPKIRNLTTSSGDSTVFPQGTGKEKNYCLLRNSQLQDVYEHLLGNNALLICKIVLPQKRKTKTLETRDPRYVNLEDKGLKAKEVVNATHYRLEPDGTGYNYASAMKSAKVVDHNKEAKGASNVLGKDHDKYLRNPCSVSNKYVVIELAEETLVDTVRIANFEHYSSNLKEFSLSGSLSYPTEMLTHAGTFVAANVKQIQTFRLSEPKWLRYLKLNLISHYGSEFYCTLSVVEVFGIDALEQMLEDLFVAPETLPSKPAMLELNQEVKTVDEKQDRDVKNNGTNQIGKETEALKKKDDVVKTINSIGDKKYEVREKHNVWKVLMHKVKSVEMNLSVLEDAVKEMNEKQPEVSLEMNRTLMLVEKSKAEIREITEWKGKMEKELRDLELWKTLVVSRVESLARGNNALRLDVEKIEREQANLESKEVGILLISLFFVVLATIRRSWRSGSSIEIIYPSPSLSKHLMSKAVLLSDDKAGLSLIEQLVPEMKTHVLSFLDHSSLCQLSMTSSLMRKAANDDYLWKSLYHQDFTVAKDNVPPVNGWKAYYAATKRIMNVNSEFCNIVAAKSLSRMHRFWLNANDVTCFYESGEIYIGHEAVMRRWEFLFNSGRFWFDFDAFEVQAEVLPNNKAFVTMFSYNHIFGGGPLRIKNAFQLHKNRWLLVHHFCSSISTSEVSLLENYNRMHALFYKMFQALGNDNCSE